MDGSISSQLFSYRKEITPFMLAFSVRAAVTISLCKFKEVHIIDGDESGAFDTPIRNDMAMLDRLWDTQCEFGNWAKSFYSRQTVRLLTCFGMTNPVRTEDGMSQGCRFAPTGYNLLGLPRTLLTSKWAGSWKTSRGCSISEFVYSDDRRWLGRSKAEIEHVIEVAHCASQEMCVVNNLSKMVYIQLTLDKDGKICPKMEELRTPGQMLMSSKLIPQIVGISCFPGACLPSLVDKVNTRLRKVRKFIKAFLPTIFLALRAAMAYGVSVLDFVARGSYISTRTLEKCQPSVNQVARSALGLPQDLPVSVLTLPITHFGWGFPNLIVRSHLLFVLGYFESLDGRNLLCRDLLREQRANVLPKGEDDFSAIQRVCAFHGLSLHIPLHLQSTPIPPLSTQFHSSAYLYVTTDASLQQNQQTPLGPSPGGIGILITDGLCKQEICWGLETLASSSTALEWLGKLMAIWILKEYGGTIILLCDSAAAQLCDFTRWVKVCPWLDRWAKLVLSQPIWSRVQEGWMQAQHDSKLRSIPAQWQERADWLAEWGVTHREAVSFPLGALFSELKDIPGALFYNGAVVFSLRRFVTALHDNFIFHQSALHYMLSKGAFHKRNWIKVIQSPGIPRSSHVAAAYLRFLPALPRVFFDIPDCRFCEISSGNVLSHVLGCPVLYKTMCKCFKGLVECVRNQVGGNVIEVSDLMSVVGVANEMIFISLSPDSLVPMVREMKRASFAWGAMIIITWSGLSWVSDVQNSFFISDSLVVELCKNVMVALQSMGSKEMGCKADEMWIHWPSLLVSYSERQGDQSRLSLNVQLRVAWLLHMLPEVRLVTSKLYHVYTPPRSWKHPDIFDIRMHVCEVNECLASTLHPGRGQVALVCPCGTLGAPWWHIYRSYPECVLYVSQDCCVMPNL
jgi:ribonuclease HI